MDKGDLERGKGAGQARVIRYNITMDRIYRFNVAKPLAVDSVGQELGKLLATALQILWRFFLSLRRALLFLPDTSRRPQRPRNPGRRRFGLRRQALAPRKLHPPGR